MTVIDDYVCPSSVSSFLDPLLGVALPVLLGWTLPSRIVLSDSEIGPIWALRLNGT